MKTFMHIQRERKIHDSFVLMMMVCLEQILFIKEIVRDFPVEVNKGFTLQLSFMYSLINLYQPSESG